jgi:CelD/BcsL family acetyltransferase involved in cellulose biosynthesis
VTAGVELRPLHSLEHGTAEWRALAELCGNVFGTPEFLSCWWQSFGDGRPLRTYAAHDGGGRLVGLLPLYEWRRRPLRVLRFLGHGAGDQLGPLVEPAFRPAVGEAVVRLLEQSGVSMLVGEQLPANEGWCALLGGRRIGYEGSPVLRFEQDTWDEYVAARTANLRQQIRRLERRLAQRHDLRYTSPRTHTELETGLDALFALHRARWSGSATNFGQRESFHRRFATIAHERGWARLWLLELDGRPAAAWYGFRFAGSECYYQMGRDPSCDHLHVGFVLLVHSLREALADGVAEYRFLRGGEAYKYRFATEDPRLESMVAGRSAVVAAAQRTLVLRRAIRTRSAT